jgi:hypothetical protein
MTCGKMSRGGAAMGVFRTGKPGLLGAPSASRLAMKDGATLFAANPPYPIAEGVCLVLFIVLVASLSRRSRQESPYLVGGAPRQPQSANSASTSMSVLGAGVAQTLRPVAR